MKYNLCGRIHFGPICVNGGSKGQPICEACKRDVDQKDRAIVGRIWLQVKELLQKHKAKSC